MYYLLSELGTTLGLDALTFGMVFVMALIGARILRIMVDSLLLAILFFPILAVAAAFANFIALALGVSDPFVVPYEDLGLIQHISTRDFISAMMVTFAGMLIGLGGILGLYRMWGHAG